MVKYAWPLLLLPVWAFSQDCRVDGISESPQEMNCYIHDKRLIEVMDLKCLNGNYLLRWKSKSFPIDVAYHEEVESGSTPLVFKSGSLLLTTTLYSLYSRAALLVGKKKYDGLCFNKVSP